MEQCCLCNICAGNKLLSANCLAHRKANVLLLMKSIVQFSVLGTTLCYTPLHSSGHLFASECKCSE